MFNALCMIEVLVLLDSYSCPCFQATKGKESLSFFSLPEYAEWRNNTENWKTYRIKYYKGLYIFGNL